MLFKRFLSDSFVPHIPKVKPTFEPLSDTHLGHTIEEEMAKHDQHPQQIFSSANPSPRNSTSSDPEKKKEDTIAVVHSRETAGTNDDYNVLHRSLKGRHVQLLGIGATIGSALFVAIGRALAKGGPLSLLLGFITWSIPILFITMSTAEMVLYLPITSPFVRMAGRCCDEALEIMTAWNFWFLCCAQIPFEVVNVNSIIHYWRDDYSPAISLAVQVVLYFFINVLGVRIYGETEFWLSIGKVFLASGLIIFTFITMVGGNPKHDAFGFRYWRDPGPMNVYIHKGDLGRFQGYLACLIQACFTFSGPEYIASVASETVNPRKTLPSAFKQVFIRLSVFFIGGALCCGILVAYNDPILTETLGVTKPGAGGSPYVIAMQNLGIKVLPDIINILLVTAAFSAGNSYTYCSSRTLYAVALDGFAPKFLTATTNTGIPIYCVAVSLLWSLISFLQLNEGSAVVLNWIINLITACQLINFTVLCVDYVFFYRALKAQGIDRRTLPFRSWFQPWLAIIGGCCAFVMIFVTSYEIFLPGKWDYQTFLFSYLFLFIDIGVFVFWKLFKRTKWKKAEEVDLVTGLREVELHEQKLYEDYARLNKLDENGNIKRTWLQKILVTIFGSEM